MWTDAFATSLNQFLVLLPSMLGTALRPTRPFSPLSTLGTPWMTLGSFMSVGSNLAGMRDTTLL
jgi:hypothetical protein